MTKAELISAVKEKANLANNTEAGRAVDAIFEAISDELRAGGSLAVKGFGTFKVETRNARKGINPATKQPIDIPAKDYVKFKASDSVLNK